MARAASIIPHGMSLSAVSTILAKKGVAAKLRGTMAAVVPILVPTISFVRGNNTIKSMMKGKDLVILITFDSMLFIILDGMM